MGAHPLKFPSIPRTIKIDDNGGGEHGDSNVRTLLY